MTATKTPISQVRPGDVIEFHGVRPSYLDTKDLPVMDWEQVPAKTPLVVVDVEAIHARRYGTGARQNGRNYVVTFEGGRQVETTSSIKVVVR